MTRVRIELPIDISTKEGTDAGLHVELASVEEDLWLEFWRGTELQFQTTISKLKELLRQAKIMQKALDECETNPEEPK